MQRQSQGHDHHGPLSGRSTVLKSSSKSRVDKILKEKLAYIRKNLVRCDEPEDTFFPDVESLWDRQTLTRLFGWEPSKIQTVWDHCLISLSILTFIEWKFDREVFRNTFVEDTTHHDHHLPFNEDNLQRLRDGVTKGLPDKSAKDFADSQRKFRPFKIRSFTQPHVSEMDRDQPWPFRGRVKQVGQGAFGEVFRAEIAEKCYKDEKGNGGMTNSTPKVVAYKRMRLKQKKGAEKDRIPQELMSQEIIRESWARTDLILTHLAAVIYDKEWLYLFFDYTKLCDLEILLNGGRKMDQRDSSKTDEVKYDFLVEFGAVSPKHLIEGLISIARALNFLHTELATPSHQLGIQCVHMDMKPDNVLVFPVDRPEIPNAGQWKLADFGISSFDDKESDEPSSTTKTMTEELVPEVSNYRRRRYDHHTLSSMGGLYRAPELHSSATRKKIPRSQCDIWSFGCIANEILAFILGVLRTTTKKESLDSAVTARREFRNTRVRGCADDFWFRWVPGSVDIPFELKPNVKTWLINHGHIIRNQHCEHYSWYCEFAKLIEDTLEIYPEKRPSAKDIVQRLTKIMRLISEAFGSAARDVTTDGNTYSGKSSSDIAATANPQYNIESSDTRTMFPGPYSTTGGRLPRQRPLVPSRNEGNSFRVRNSATNRESGTGTVASSSYRSSLSSSRSMGLVSSNRSIRPDTPPSSRPSDSSPRLPLRDEIRILPLPPQTEFFAISAGADQVASLYKTRDGFHLAVLNPLKQGSQWQRLEIEPLNESKSWDTFSLASPYLMSAGKHPDDSSRNNGFIINLITREKSALNNGWPQNCILPTISSRGILAWVEWPGVWIGNSETRRRLVFGGKPKVVRICFNPAGTKLFVWTHDQGFYDKIYILDAYDFSSSDIIELASVGFCKELKQYDDTYSQIWVAQSRSACLIQESTHLPRRYLRVSGEAQATPLDIENEGPLQANPKTFLLDEWMVTALRESQLIGYKLKIIKRRIPMIMTRESNTMEGEEMPTQLIKMSNKEFRLAACDDLEKRVERVLVMTGCGKMYIWETPMRELPGH